MSLLFHMTSWLSTVASWMDSATVRLVRLFCIVVVLRSSNLVQTVASIILPSTVEWLSLVNDKRPLDFFDYCLEGDGWALRIPALCLFVSYGLFDSIRSRVQLRGNGRNTSDCS